MSEPIETVVTDMRKFMGAYGMSLFSPSFSFNRGSIDRKINRQLFISGRKRNISKADSQDNFSSLVSRTPQRKSREEKVDYDEEENENDE